MLFLLPLLLAILSQVPLTVSEGFCQSSGSCQDDPKVVTKSGAIVGSRIRINETDINQFLGIPFAEKPTGPLRFKTPVPLKEPWREPLMAKKFKSGCLQSNMKHMKTSSEDCLYLNIWAPTMKLTDAPKSVMVYFHGGSFAKGTASEKNANSTIIAAMGDVIVVTANYRLGFLDS